MKTKEFPRSACLMPLAGIGIRLADGAEESSSKSKDGPRRFEMVINTGKVMDHPWWGKFAIDLEGVEIPHPRMAALASHDHDQRVGFFERNDVEIADAGLRAEGTFLQNEHAERLISDMEQGFPMQASPHLVPTVLEEVLEQGETEVNGQTISGPALIFRESRLLESSFVAVGADDDTVATAFASEATQLSAQVLEEEEKPMAAKKKKKGKKAAASKRRQDAVLSDDADDTQVDDDQEPEDDATDEPSGDDSGSDDTGGADEGGEKPPEPEGRKPGAVAMERKRASTIIEAAHPSQLELAQELVGSDTTLDQALLKLNKDLKRRIEEGDTGSVALSSDEPLGGDNTGGDADGGDDHDPSDPDAKLKKEWKGSSKLRDEFSNDFEAFKFYRAAEKDGRLRIAGKGA